jgi:hypothetical protein
VNLQENAELIQQYLVILRLRREEAEKNYIPTPWEKLSPEEQLLLATYHAHIHQEEDLEQEIQFRCFLRDIREKNHQLSRKRYLEKSQILNRYPIFFFQKKKKITTIEKSRRKLTSNLSFCFTAQCLPSRPASLDKKDLVLLLQWTQTTDQPVKNPNVSRKSPNPDKRERYPLTDFFFSPSLIPPCRNPLDPNDQSSKAPSQLQQDLAAAKELQARVEKLQMTTLVRKETATASSNQPPKEKDLPPNAEKDTPMEVDEIDSESSEATPTRPSTPEIRVLSKNDLIKRQVREHVELWKKCQVATREGPTAKLRALLTTAQESQKALQKLIDNDEIEAYVKGWNPWEEKKIHFPAPIKKNVMKFKKTDSGKRQSSTSTDYADPVRWKKAADLLQIAAGLYQNL